MTNNSCKPQRPPITILEPKEANNVTAEELTWPIAEFCSYGGITTVDDLSHQLAERIAAAPPEKRAELQARVNAEIARAIAAASPVA